MNHTRHSLRALLLCAGMLTTTGFVGCGPSGPQENKAAPPLRKILQAYDLASYKNGHPPRDAEELKPFLEQLSPGDKPDELLRSPNDGEPYEIVWGVNLERITDANAIMAYEQKGVGGKRYVITAARIVKEMTDEEFTANPPPKPRKSGKGK